MLLPTLPVTYEFMTSTIYRTIVSGPDPDTPLQRRNKSPYGPLHKVTIRADALTSEEEALYRFYCARRGGWEAFSMFDPSVDKLWCDEYLGTETGLVGTWDLKGKNTTGHVITVGGVANTDFTIGDGTGTNGQDQLIFAPIPVGIIKAEFTGCLYIPACVFAVKGLDRKRFAYALWTMGIDILEVPS